MTEFRRIDAQASIRMTTAMAGEDADPRDFWPFLAGALKADYLDLASKFNRLFDAMVNAVPDTDMPFELEVTGGKVTGVKIYPDLRPTIPIRHGTDHVTAEPPYTIPLAARMALDKALAEPPPVAEAADYDVDDLTDADVLSIARRVDADLWADRLERTERVSGIPG